ncbi:MAG: heat-inducible transcription repressor HrcA [Nitrospinae bacterium]|nr:heat-inducible transcription repressor HrcA [Nitrospinota bacterium]
MDTRSAMVLKAVVEGHIASSEPVGARIISKRSEFNLSPASIRNVMAGLEESGFLEQPHTSAGRIPSDKGYRYYAQSMAGPAIPSTQEMDRIHSATHGAAWQELTDLLAAVSRALSDISSQASLVGIASISVAPVNRIRFVHIAEKRALAVMVMSGGEIRNQLIETAEPLEQDDLDKISNCFNAKFSGMTLEGVRQALMEEMRDEKARADKLLSHVLMMAELIGERVSVDANENISLDGASNLLNLKGVTLDIAALKNLFRTLDEKSRLVSLLTSCLKPEGINLIIGSEFEMEGFSDYSMVAHRFKGHDGAMGAVGIIGPKAMDYARAMGLVLYTANQVGSRLNG